jgi:4-aminobutyrate aminotransferase-like enzyme/Ser/Thr protein kinase RdoA (MazF antagonist)
MQLDQIKQHIRSNYGLEVDTSKSLSSYADSNFHLQFTNGESAVWKIAGAEETVPSLHAQHKAMEQLARVAPHLNCPRPLRTQAGNTLVSRLYQGKMHQTRLLTWVEGTPLGFTDPPTPALLGELGRFLGEFTSALQHFDHPGAHRPLIWDLSTALEMQDRADAIEDPQRRRIAQHLFLQLRHATPTGMLRKSVIHNDVNDYNILVGSEGSLSGLIDFGDLLYGPTIDELAVACAYVMLRQTDPITSACQLITGFHAAYPLLESEMDALFQRILRRLLLSVVHSAYLAPSHPDPAYLKISEAPVWALLEHLMSVPPDLPTERFRGAWGAPTHPGKDLHAQRRAHLPANLSLHYTKPLHVVRGIGSYLYAEGEGALLDLVNNVAHVGHSHPKMVQAANTQLTLLNTNSRYLHPLRSEYARRLCATFPKPLEVCFLVCTGSEANELALRLARTHTGRHDVLVTDSGYHGNTSNLIDISPYKFNGKGGQGQRDWVHTIPTPDPFRGPFRGPDCAPFYVKALQKQLSTHSIGAFFMESLSGCGGQIVPPTHFLKDAFETVRAHGGVSIADEVQVGMGRVGSHFWAFQAQNALPDIVTIGKPIGNGHPLAAVVTTRAIADSFCTGMEYFNTFGANPVSCAVGLAVLDVIQGEGLQEHAHTLGSWWLKELQAMQHAHPLIGQVRGMGLFIGIELVRDRTTLQPADTEATAVAESLRRAGILISIDGPHHNVLKLKPPMVISQADAQQVLDALEHSLKTIQ